MDDILLIAHSANQSGRQQPLLEHLGAVAHLAAQFAQAFQSERFAEWLGWWHDAGKVAPSVQKYLRGAGPSKDHSSAGMLEAWDLPELSFLALNIGGHHGGLANLRGEDSLRSRVQAKQSETRVVNARKKAKTLIDPKVTPITASNLPNFLRDTNIAGNERYRRLEFWIRMLHSTLVDADCLNTEAHFHPDKAALRSKRRVAIKTLWERYQIYQRKHQEKTTKLNVVRNEIYKSCLSAASKPPGIFSLTVPTGGGKTRSVMGFALKHAMIYQKQRVIVVLPYTSVIDQNAQVYRDIFEVESEDAGHIVLEHHSNFRPKDKNGDESEGERWRRLAAENWDADVIVTTSVQFFESLFASRNRRIRKLHRLANSIIVLDEVQTFPPRLLESTLEVLQELVDCYGATLVLCTATQPALHRRQGFLGFRDVVPIIGDPEPLYRQLKRVQFTKDLNSHLTHEEVATRARMCHQAMVVLNSIDDAERIFRALDEDSGRYHLSTKMCPAHRMDTLDQIKKRLKKGDAVRLISTQVVETGMDISFPYVMRALGPLDSLIQAAGRCNREKEQDYGDVTVFQLEGGKCPPGAYRTGKEITERILRDANSDFDNPALIERYFEELYKRRHLDKFDIQSLREGFCYEQVAQRYRVIDQPSMSYVVRYQSVDEEKKNRVRKDDIDKRILIIRKRGYLTRGDWQWLCPYIVTLYVWKHEQAIVEGFAEPLLEDSDDLFLWPENYYSAEEGIIWPGPERLVI